MQEAHDIPAVQRALLECGRTGTVIVGSGRVLAHTALSELIARLGGAGATIRVVCGIRPGCPWQPVRELAREAITDETEWVLAAGGGSVIDAAKLVALRVGRKPLAAISATVDDLRAGIGAAIPIPVFAVPTCIGSGAEVSPVADVLRDDEPLKDVIVSPKLVPRQAFLVPDLCRNVPAAVQRAAIVDALCHLLDPFVSSASTDVIQESMTIALAREVVSFGSVIGGRQATDEDLARFWWVSQMAVLPGVGRAPAPSVLHRIEHGLTPVIECRHGEGLALLLPHFLEEVEACHPQLRSYITDVIADVFRELAPPSTLIRRWLASLKVQSTAVPESVPVDKLAERILRCFGEAGQLPGGLRFGFQEVRRILERSIGRGISPPATRTIPRPDEARTERPSEIRLFGQSVKGTWAGIILTPVLPLFEAVCGYFPGCDVARGWVESARLGDRGAKWLLLRTSPGATAALDSLEFAWRCGARPEEVFFLGLAGSLHPDYSPGTIATVRRVRTDTVGLSAPERLSVTVGSEGRRRIGAALASVAAPPLAEAGICRSVLNLSGETRDMLKALARVGTELIDLEASTVAGWCSQHGLPLIPMFVVSDRPLKETPLWCQDQMDEGVWRGISQLAGAVRAIVLRE